MKGKIGFMNDKPVYWDAEEKKLFWVEMVYKGIEIIPLRHYLEIDIKELQDTGV